MRVLVMLSCVSACSSGTVRRAPLSTATKTTPTPAIDATILIRFRDVLVPVACFDTANRELHAGFEDCRLPARTTLHDDRGRERAGVQTSRSYCRRAVDHSPQQFADTESIDGYRVAGSAPPFAQIATRPIALVAAASRIASKSPADRQAIGTLVDGRWGIVQAVTGDFDGDHATDRAFIVRTPVREDQTDYFDLVIVPAHGTPWKLPSVAAVRSILAVSDIDRDGKEELIVWQEEAGGIHTSGFSLLVPSNDEASTYVAPCDGVPTYIDQTGDEPPPPST